VFCGRVNAEFVSVLADNELRMRVWERGSGVTKACGTGACASAAAAVAKGFCRADEPIRVHLDGGELEIIIKKNFTAVMRGGAEFVSDGEINE
jgi:diaminopimelate epimerase